MTRYGLIGRRLDYSFSRGYFTEKFAREGLRDREYLNFEIESLRELPRVLATPGLAGLNVTIPFKRDVVAHLDALDETARGVGAVNCIRFAGSRLVGYNTDVDGVLATLDAVDYPGGDDAADPIVLGTGGAAAAVAFALSRLGQSAQRVSRDPDAGQLGYDQLAQLDWTAPRLIVNATPVGTYPAVDRAPALPYERLGPQHTAFDLVYNPAETLFLSRARARGARTTNGRTMLYAQAEAAWRIWNAQPARTP